MQTGRKARATKEEAKAKKLQKEMEKEQKRQAKILKAEAKAEAKAAKAKAKEAKEAKATQGRGQGSGLGLKSYFGARPSIEGQPGNAATDQTFSLEVEVVPSVVKEEQSESGSDADSAMDVR